MITYHVIWSTIAPSFIESMVAINRGDVVTHDGRTFEVLTVRHIPVPLEGGPSHIALRAYKPTLVMREV